MASQQPMPLLTWAQVRAPLADDALDAVEVEEALDADVLEVVEDALVDEVLVLVEEALVEEVPVEEVDEAPLAGPPVLDVLVDEAPGPVPPALPPVLPPVFVLDGAPPCPEDVAADPPIATTSPMRSGP
jgi:hypothetical protein